ncbi:Glucose-6-phosphate exchanger SLC37A2, partial [Eschrichtius robustus]|nr:Glucose-6-phosphate exchanger SLC37A2 [Eschrichtius robustus]
YRGFILLITFLIYTCYHMSRKPISVVKSRLHRNCSGMIRPINDTHSLNDTTWCNWAPFDQSNYKELLGAVDNAFLVAYAVGMFIRKMVEAAGPTQPPQVPAHPALCSFVTMRGPIAHCPLPMVSLVGSICNGLVQTTGWPSVVTCVGNWFGKG